MNEKDREKIDTIIADRKDAHRFYSDRSPVYNAFTQMEHTAYSDGALERMHKELIAVGISVVINCESCMEWHIKQAIDAGADTTQVIEAIGIGIEMGGGPATVSARFAMKVLEYYQK
jgi:AhpD family alkylhydroperoxidase